MIAAIGLFLALGLDTFAVALGLGMKGTARRHWVRIGLTFALFEGLMPVVGLLLGKVVVGRVGEIMTYVAGVLLLAVGAWEIREAREEQTESVELKNNASESQSLPALGLAISLDELAVGFSLGVLGVPIGAALGYIALQAFAITLIGLAVGNRVGVRLQTRAEVAAGVLLLLLGAIVIVTSALGIAI